MGLDDRIENAPNPRIQARRMFARGDAVGDIANALGFGCAEILEWIFPRPMSRPPRQLITGTILTLSQILKGEQ